MENKKSETATTPSPAVGEKPFMRSVVILKNKKRLRETEMMYDCFILDFNPYESSTLLKSVDQDDDAPLTVIAEKGHVACRDFPHSRHQCAVHPFSNTPHQKHCKLCYCYVCDVAAPCTKWSDHCHATDMTHERACIQNPGHLPRACTGRNSEFGHGYVGSEEGLRATPMINQNLRISSEAYRQLISEISQAIIQQLKDMLDVTT